MAGSNVVGDVSMEMRTMFSLPADERSENPPRPQPVKRMARVATRAMVRMGLL